MIWETLMSVASSVFACFQNWIVPFWLEDVGQASPVDRTPSCFVRSQQSIEVSICPHPGNYP